MRWEKEGVENKPGGLGRCGWRRRVEDKRLGFSAENERTNRS